MNERLLELLGRLDTLTADELAELQDGLKAAAAAVDVSDPAALTDEQVEQLEALASAVELTTAEVDRRDTEQAQAAEAKAARLAEVTERLAKLAPPAEPAAEETPEPAVEETREPVAAAATRRTPAVAAMSTRTPAAHTLAVEVAKPAVRQSLVASSYVPKVVPGTEFGSVDEVARAITSTLQSLTASSNGSSDGAGQKVPVATFVTPYPAELRLVQNDDLGNMQKLERVFEDDAVVAAGGRCGPLPVDYSIAEVGNLDRPIRDSLARFQADRGGIRTNVPPSLTQADAGFGIWTLLNDTLPGDVSIPAGERLATKPVVEFTCGTSVESLVYAATYRARFSNLTARFSPEEVASQTRMGLVSHARLAELQLLRLLYAQATAVTAGALLGASKDFFAHLDVMVAHMRYRQRRVRTQAFVLYCPEWVMDMLRADFVRQMPAGDPTSQYAVADAAMAAMFAARNVRPVWQSEDLDGAAGIGRAQAAGVILDWPDTVRLLLAYEGDYVFLDGGELDLGIVRDSALNAVNRYETFYESFEGVHFRGAEKPLLVTATLNPNGSAAGLVATATGNATADL